MPQRKARIAKEVKTAFSAYLYELRSAAGWSLRDLSASSGIGHNHLWLYEHGRRVPRLHTLVLLSRAFEMPLYRFLRPLDALGLPWKS